MPEPMTTSDVVRMADLVAALSLATDAANDFPSQKAAKTALVAVRLAAATGLRSGDLSAVYWGGLLRFLGCTAFSHEEAHHYGAGDDYTVKRAMGAAEFAPSRSAALRGILTTVGSGAPARRRALAVTELLMSPDAPKHHAQAACDAATHLADRLGMSPAV